VKKKILSSFLRRRSNSSVEGLGKSLKNLGTALFRTRPPERESGCYGDFQNHPGVHPNTPRNTRHFSSIADKPACICSKNLPNASQETVDGTHLACVLKCLPVTAPSRAYEEQRKASFLLRNFLYSQFIYFTFTNSSHSCAVPLF